MAGIVRLVAALSAIGFDGPSTYRRIRRHIHDWGRFLVLARPAYGGCAWEAERSAGVLYARSVNLRTAATHSFDGEPWQLFTYRSLTNGYHAFIPACSYPDQISAFAG